MAYGDRDYSLEGTEGLQITYNGAIYTLDENISCHISAPIWDDDLGDYYYPYCEAVGRLTDDEDGNSREVYYDFDSIEQMEEWEKNRNFSACITGILVLEDADEKNETERNKDAERKRESDC